MFVKLRQQNIPLSNGVNFYPKASGVNHFYNVPRQGEHAMWYHVVRTHEREEFLRDLDDTGAIAWLGQEQPTQDPCKWLDYSLYPKDLCEAIGDRLGRVLQAGPEAWVFPILRPGSGEESEQRQQ